MNRLVAVAHWVLRFALLCALIGQAGRVFYPFDTMNHLVPIWGSIGLIAGLMLLVARQASWRDAAITVVLILIVARLIHPDFSTPSASTPSLPVAPGAAKLKIVAFNASKGNSNPAEALAWLQAQRADLVILAEAKENSAVLLGGLKGQYPYQVSCLSGLRCSTVILSRTRPIDSGGLARGDPENGNALSAAWATYADPGGPYTVIGVHFVRPWPWGDQRTFVPSLLNFIARTDRRRLIVTGDFNLTPWSFTLREIDAQLAIPRLTRAMPSWPATRSGHASGLPALLPIDHVYAGPAWRLRSLQRGPYLGSDHYPLVATFQ